MTYSDSVLGLQGTISRRFSPSWTPGAKDMVPFLLINTFWLSFASLASNLFVGMHSHFLYVRFHLPASMALNWCAVYSSEVLPFKGDFSDITANGIMTGASHLLDVWNGPKATSQA